MDILIIAIVCGIWFVVGVICGKKMLMFVDNESEVGKIIDVKVTEIKDPYAKYKNKDGLYINTADRKINKKKKEDNEE